MRELGFDGVSEDQRFLIVRDRSTDERFRVCLDDEAAQLVTSPDVSSSATGSEPVMDIVTPLSPRDIQTRIRRGESAQQVADSSGMPLERVDAFAGPVIAEREYMVGQARKTSIRRRHVPGAGVVLGTLVDSAIIDGDGNPEAATWDSWRREDGRWTILVTPDGAASTASFVFDARGRYVVPADDLAHELVGDISLPDTPDMAIADAVRTSTDTSTSTDEVGMSGQLSIDSVEITTDLTDLFDQVPADIAAAEALLEAAEPHSGVSSLKAARDRRTQEALAKQESEAEVDVEIQAEVDHLESAIESDVAVPDTAGPRGKKRQERRRVPSWDEIMFGDKND